MGDNPLDDFEDIIPDWDEVEEETVAEFPAPALIAIETVDPIDDPLDTSRVGLVLQIIEEMIVALQAAKAVPLSQNVLVDREAFISNLQRISDGIPEEVRQARWMVRERVAFVSRTNEKAREIAERARTRSRELISQSHVLAEAVEEANVLVRNAESEARRIRLDAEDYSEERLAYLEKLFGTLLQQAREARLEWHEARPGGPEAPI